MLRSLVRFKFVDRCWGAETFQALAEFWVCLFDEAEHPQRECWETHQTLEFRLTGFARSASIAFSQELTRRFFEAGVPVELSADDPDTIVAKAQSRKGNSPPYGGLGIDALGGPLFDGMLVEIRFTVVDRSANEEPSGSVGATLVVVGAIQEGTVAVKAIWVDPPFMTSENAWQAQFPGEDQLLAAFDEYRTIKQVDSRVATALFNSWRSAPIRKAKGIEAWLNVPFGQPRLRGLLLRGGILSVLIIGYVTSLALTVLLNWSLLPWIFLFVPVTLIVFIPTAAFLRNECATFWLTYLQYRASYEKCFDEFPRFESLKPDDPKPWLQDPIVRKVTVEVLEAGFVHAGDFTTIPMESAESVESVFFAPDGVTYLILGFRFTIGSGTERWGLWPVGCGFSWFNVRFKGLEI